jgi:hypothetical protein
MFTVVDVAGCPSKGIIDWRAKFGGDIADPKISPLDDDSGVEQMGSTKKIDTQNAADPFQKNWWEEKGGETETKPQEFCAESGDVVVVLGVPGQPQWQAVPFIS